MTATSTKLEGRLFHYEQIDDIIETSKIFAPRTYSSYSNIPSLLQPKTKFLDQSDPDGLNKDFRDRFHSALPRSASSSLMINPDARRKELDQILKHLYEGKRLKSIQDDRPSSGSSDSSVRVGERSLVPSMTKLDDETKTPRNSDLFSFDGDLTSLQRELQEKDLDIRHLHKEIEELQLENKLLQAQVPNIRSHHKFNDNDVAQREKDVLHNELRLARDLIVKLQHQQPLTVTHSTGLDGAIAHEKEKWRRKLRDYEKRLRLLTSENEKLKQNSQQAERTISQLKREKEELQERVAEATKRNEELFIQEFHSIRNDLKTLKERNNDLCEENDRLKRPSSPPPAPSSLKTNHRDSKTSTSESSTDNDSKNDLTLKYSNGHRRPVITADHHLYSRPMKYQSIINNEESYAMNYPYSISKSSHPQVHYRPVKNDQKDIPYQPAEKPSYASPSYRSMTNDTHHASHRTTTNQLNPDPPIDHRRPSRTYVENISSKRPYAPLSISEVRLNDTVKFSRPGGKISKGIVKYIGLLPDRSDDYLGLELEEEDSQHDGVFQGQRFFQCKPNKGVFIGFSRVIMAWSGGK